MELAILTYLVFVLVSLIPIVVGVGKRKVRNIRISYPDDAVSNMPSMSIQYHRTPKGRLSHRVRHLGDMEELTQPADSDGGSTSAPVDEPPAEPPWAEDFFSDHPAVDTPDIVSSNAPPLPTTRSFFDDYVEYRQSILNEMLLQEGRAGGRACEECIAEDGIYKCKDCFHPKLLCASCIMMLHDHLPFHRLLRWEDGYFMDCNLQSLGMVLSLNHDGQRCPVAPGIERHSVHNEHGGQHEPATTDHQSSSQADLNYSATSQIVRNFVVVDVSGVHIVDIIFCRCYQPGLPTTRREQLLRHQLFPATLLFPRAAFTFDLLNTFHLLTLQSKVAAYDFYRAIAQKTDNTGLKDLPDYYERFLDVMRVWRNLMSAKRSGRGHDPSGTKGTKPGQCAVECPACPHPGINLPVGWADAPPERRWIYSLILTMDANFRLKNRERLIKNDVALGDGWGHWVPYGPFLEHLKNHTQDSELNLCESQWRAINQANSKRSLGYSSTGIGGIVCGRHGLVRKNGFGDLQKGERYANMDFILFQTLAGAVFRRLLLSYDIACQYSRHLFTRMKDLPRDLQIPDELTKYVDYVIPKFHLFGHGTSCQLRYSINLLPGCAHSDLEDPERWWAHINPISMSTKLMTPWARRETIDDHARGWNWRKITHFGSSLLHSLNEAAEMAARHSALHAKFTASFPPEVITTWEDEILAWENDHSKPNPYDDGESRQDNLAAIRLELSKEEIDQMTADSVGSGPVGFLCAGMDLEEKQRSIRASASNDQTPNQAADLQEQRNTLLRRILAWRELQKVYMPTVASDLLPDAHLSTDKPELQPLFLPSQLPTPLESLESLCSKEARLRIGQADDALIELRRLLRITVGMWDFKFTDVGFSQMGNTRARSAINRFRTKVNRTAERYRGAHRALLALSPNSDVLARLRPLNQDDVRCPQRGEKELRPGESRREVSWIWLSVATGSEGTERSLDSMTPVSIRDINDSLRAEWARSRARQSRWLEEQQLVQEEMRRVLAFLESRANWWVTQGSRRAESATPELMDGLHAYATKQAAILRGLRLRFASMWHPRLQAFQFTATWFDDDDLGLESVVEAVPARSLAVATAPSMSLDVID